MILRKFLLLKFSTKNFQQKNQKTKENNRTITKKKTIFPVRESAPPNVKNVSNQRHFSPTYSVYSVHLTTQDRQTKKVPKKQTNKSYYLRFPSILRREYHLKIKTSEEKWKMRRKNVRKMGKTIVTNLN